MIIEMYKKLISDDPIKWKMIWRWDQLRRLGESRVAQLTSLLPIFALALSSAQSLETYFSATLVSLNMLFFFYGLLCFSIGTLGYVLFAPYQTGKYIDDVEYYNHEKSAWWDTEKEKLFYELNIKLLKDADLGIMNSFRDHIEDIVKNQNSSESNRIIFTRLYYRYLTYKTPKIRFLVSLFYLLGFVLTSIPIVLRISGLTISVMF